MACAFSRRSSRRTSRAERLQVDFYQLGAAPIERVLARIAGRVLADGGRLLVVTASADQAQAVDRALWTDDAASFLPHGRAEADGAEEQPVLIGARCVATNAARNVALIDGTWRDDALGFDRAFHFFDEESVEAAREAWRAVRGKDGVEPRYWRQDEDGRWQQMG